MGRGASRNDTTHGKFLIEVARGNARDWLAQERSSSGPFSFLTHADWGCKDGEHKAWLIIDVASKEEARSVVPSEFRSKAKIVGLNAFTQEDIDATLRQHGA